MISVLEILLLCLIVSSLRALGVRALALRPAVFVRAPKADTSFAVRGKALERWR